MFKEREVSEQPLQPTRRPGRLAKRLGAATAGAAVVATGIGIGVAHEQSQDRKIAALEHAISRQDSKINNVPNIAQAEVTAQQNAASLAAEYTQALRTMESNTSSRRYVPMQVLNGEIRITFSRTIDVKGGNPPTYRNPILLATLDPEVKPDAAGKFLQGAYIGVQSTDATGNKYSSLAL